MTETIIQKSTLGLILESLGLEKNDLESEAGQDTYRIVFEKNFGVELIDKPQQGQCRTSARVCLLGKSLNSQEKQITKALNIFTEVIENAPTGISLAVSDHDGCLRLVFDIDNKQHTDPCATFEEFLNFSFAFKQTFLELK